MEDAGRSSTVLIGALRALKMWCAVAVALALMLLGAASAHAQATPVKVLVFHGASSDPTTAAGVAAIKALGTANDFGVDDTEMPTDFNAGNLGAYRAVVFLNTSGDKLNASQETAFQTYIQGGGGFVGIGSAAEAEPGVAFFDGVIGARPAATSPTATTQQVVEVGDRFHPATKNLPLEWSRSDVWYQWQTRPTGTVHTVARYRAPDAAPGDGTNVSNTDSPISWCRDYQGGRSFYTGMGRTADSYGENNFKGHLLGAIKWTAGLVRAGCKATIYSNYKSTRVVSGGPATTGLATSGESHGLTVAPNGWVIYIGRGDCRTDAERGALIGKATQPRVLDHSDPNVGLGCGSVHVWDPSAYSGTENSGVTRAATLAVYADGGTGNERTDQTQHKMEYGLLGVTVAPDFLQTGHVYLQYFPSFNEQAKPPGLPVARRISKMSRPRISRFTMNLQTKKLDLDSEVRIFEYDAQVFSCCHVGGGMGFDSQGNLYITTGDTNSSQSTGGYSGNNPDDKCPLAPAGQENVPTSANCGATTYSYRDARRTAGNTNDYNGKMLRFKPADIPDGQHPAVGIGSTYTIPGAGAPNGPNLFSGTEGTGNQAKPEIYAMGLRNPSRLSIDPKTDIPYSGWVGPDAGAPSRDLGPSTYETLTQVDRAGNYGWPYCMGNKQAYRDRLPGNVPRTDLPEGYVVGGPATAAGTNGWYDCDNIVNDSPNNTGLRVLPHATGTGMDAGAMRPSNLWYSRGNPGGNGCPDFTRPRGGNAAPDYGAANTQKCPYATANGATVMDGPVYRYDGQASDNSRRWPQYWDGRWFIDDHGNTSVKHAVMLDPATAKNGGQPVYADSFRFPQFAWSGNYMDSKFGPDGAWYVQTYDGFFRAGPNVGIWRIEYTGGPDTPMANPSATAVGNKQVNFSSAGSGGVSYDWDFGDGTAHSSDANPTHTYAQPGHYSAKLTVTYREGDPSVKTVEVDVLDQADSTAPATTATLDPAQPGPGGTYNRPVTVTLTATDTGGTGVAKTEYRIDSGAFQTYTQPFKVSSTGDHTIEYRSTDGAANEEATKSVSFKIDITESCPTSLSDEFNGTVLDPKWQVVRDNPGARSLSNGRLHMLVRNGDMIAGTATAQNLLLQDAPEDGGWTATTKIGIAELSNSGEQTGLVVWQSENPNNFVKVVFINKGNGTRWFEYVLTQNGSTVRLPNTGAINDLPDDVYVRAISNGQGTITPEYSLDGEDWKPIGDPVTELGTKLKVGIKVSDTADSANAAHFDWFHFDCQDRAAPVTTATVNPAKPDGDLAWYSTAPKVTLAADDGSAGTGVDTTEYRIGTTGAYQPYTAPFTVSQPGRQTIQYRSTDKGGNVEPAKSLSLAVDPQAPTTTARVDRPSADAATVALTAGDGSGAGVREIRYRVDGGDWKTYSGPAADQVLLDGTAAALAKWKQAGPGGFDLQPDGSIQAHGGLGMLWYPVKPFGDFALKLQFRDARTDSGYANSGAFVRFPNPDTTVALPSNQRPACVTANEDRPEWVAIFCGQENQMYDGPTGEPQKTGSIYNFQSLNIAQAMAVPKGDWSDYEVRVVGQQYTIVRDGTVINQFDNSIPKNSSRGGDPPTQDRQFAQGYIGLQNHSDADKMQIRNLRVQDLSDAARAGTGAFTVSGNGNHTVEFRSTDWAGNVEPTKAETFRIGAPPQGSPPPASPAPPSFSLAKLPKTSLAGLGRQGLKVKVTCTGAMQGTAALKVTSATKRKLKLKSTTLASKSVLCAGAGSKTVTLKPSSKVAKALRKSSRAVKTTVELRLRAIGQPTKIVRKSLTLRK